MLLLPNVRSSHLVYELRLLPKFSRQIGQVAFHEGGVANHVLRDEAEKRVRNSTYLCDRDLAARWCRRDLDFPAAAKWSFKIR